MLATRRGHARGDRPSRHRRRRRASARQVEVGEPIRDRDHIHVIAASEAISRAAAYAGPIVVNGGTLRQAQSAQVAPTAAVTVNSAGVFDVSHFAGGPIGSLAGDGSVTLGAAGLAVGGNNSSTTVAGTISGLSDSVSRTSPTKVGTGTLTLTGTNTYEGYTRIEEGTLLVNGSMATGPFSDVVLIGGTLGGIGTLGRLYAASPGPTIRPGGPHSGFLRTPVRLNTPRSPLG